MEEQIRREHRQLTKAKEIINALVKEVNSYEEVNGFDKCDSATQAEQFLRK